MLFEKPPETMS